MSYYFTKTLQGPAVVGSDEVVFFHEYEVLEKYIDADFFERAYGFCAKVVKEHAAKMSEMIIKGKPENDEHPLSFIIFDGLLGSKQMLERVRKRTTSSFS